MLDGPSPETEESVPTMVPFPRSIPVILPAADFPVIRVQNRYVQIQNAVKPWQTRFSARPSAGSASKPSAHPESISTEQPEGDPSVWNRSRRETLIIPESSVSQDGADVINRLDEERFPSERIINRPSGEAVPSREKRFRIARSTAGRGSEARKRLPDAPDRRKEDGLCPPLNNPESRPDARYGNPDAIIISPYAPTDETRNSFIRATSPNRRSVRRPASLITNA